MHNPNIEVVEIHHYRITLPRTIANTYLPLLKEYILLTRDDEDFVLHNNTYREEFIKWAKSTHNKRLKDREVYLTFLHMLHMGLLICYGGSCEYQLNPHLWEECKTHISINRINRIWEGSNKP